MNEQAARHGRACQGFSAAVERIAGRWEKPTPCPEWDARGVVEHVIGFHDVLLLRPAGTKPARPKGDPVTRWALTVPAILVAVDRPTGDDPAVGGEPDAPDVDRLLPLLTVDVLAHTWDLARAVGVDPQLDPELCRIAYQTVRPNDHRLRASGMFGTAVPVGDDADPPTRLIAFLGRDPTWSPPGDG